MQFVNLSKVSGYETNLTIEQQGLVKWLSANDTLGNMPNDGCIYAITASQLLAVMKHYPKSMVYLWTPGCTSDCCLPLSSMQDVCDERGMELFVVATSFAGAFAQNTAVRNHPVYIPNERIYQQRRFEDCTWEFVEELIGSSNYKKYYDELYHSRYLFEGDTFVGVALPQKGDK